MNGIVIARHALLDLLAPTASVAPKNSTIPILGNVLLSASGGRLQLSASDSKIWVSAWGSADGDIPPLTVSAQKLMAVAKSLPPDATLDISHDEQWLKVKSGRSRFRLGTLPAQDYPELEADTSASTHVAVESIGGPGDLARLIEATAYAMAVDDVRFYLNGMLLEIQPGLVRTVGTDGHRLAICEIEGETGVTEPVSGIIPARSVAHIVRMLKDADTLLGVSLSPTRLAVSAGTLSISTKLIDGRYPDYNRVIPAVDGAGRYRLRVDRDEFLAALRRVAVMAGGASRGVRLQIDEAIDMSAMTPDGDESADSVPVASYDGPPLEIGFNVNYLIAALERVTCSEAEVSLGSASEFILILDGQSRHVIMPMRL